MHLRRLACLVYVPLVLSAQSAPVAEVQVKDWASILRWDGVPCRGRIVAKNQTQLFLQLAEENACGPKGEIVWAKRAMLGSFSRLPQELAGKQQQVWLSAARDGAKVSEHQISVGRNTPKPSAFQDTATQTTSAIPKGLRNGSDLTIFTPATPSGCKAKLRATDQDSLLLDYQGGRKCPQRTALALLEKRHVTRFHKHGPFWAPKKADIDLRDGTPLVPPLLP